MDEKRAVSLIKKIKSRINAVKATAIILIIAALLLPINIFLRIPIMLFIAIVSIIIIFQIRGSSLKILTDECDPETYYAVVHGVYIPGTTALTDAQVSFFIGDFYASVKNISAQLARRQNPLSEFEYTFLLAQNAFFAGDFEMCTDACEKAEKLLSTLKVKEANKNAYECSLDFYSHYISGDYNGAIHILKSRREKSPSKAANASRVLTDYCWAVTHYYNGDINEAVKYFNAVIDFSPKFFIAQRAEQYLQAIHNNEIMEIEHNSLDEAFETGRALPPTDVKRKTKKGKSLLVGILLIAVGMLMILNIPGIKSGEAYDVISRDTEIDGICEMIDVDDDYSLCIFDTPYDEIGVACLKNSGDNKYTYCISYAAEPEIYLYDDNGYYIYASGEAPRIYFDITDDAALVPENSEMTKFYSKGKEYCFYIFKTEYKYNYWNSSGVNNG